MSAEGSRCALLSSSECRATDQIASVIEILGLDEQSILYNLVPIADTIAGGASEWVVIFRKKRKIKLDLISELGGFDADWYLYANVDVAESGQDPLEHYLTTGWIEGRNPNPYFSTRGYLEANPDVAAAGMNPLVHFWNHGMAEGRNGWQILIKPTAR